jgi:hypothetical protein
MSEWTPEIVRARFVEAAYTEQFLPTARAPSSRGFWPAFFHDEEDKKGWDDAARLENAERRHNRAPSGAISRHAECLQWTGTILHDEKRRHIVWSWAFCRANGWDFGARCVRKGWVRQTAYRRLSASIDAIVAALGNDAVLLRLPDDKWVRHETPDMAPISSTLGRSDETASAIPNKPYVTEKPRDLIQTQADADAFAQFLDRRNADMRRAQEREAKRRLKLGMGAV